MKQLGFVLALSLLACRGESPAADAGGRPQGPPQHEPPPPPAPAPAPPPAPEPTPEPEPAPTPSPASDPTANAWWRDAVFYEIFVRSFQDSDGDGIGDLQGIIDRLDHLNDGNPDGGDDLGVDAIWLMPIHPSPSYHGYDVIDYRDVAAEYGGLAALDALVAEGKKRGVRIIIDFLLNHASERHPWFRSSRDPKSPHRDYFVWRDDHPSGWARPWDGAPLWHELGENQYYYALFWSGMPDWNLEHPDVEREMYDVMRFWLKRGIAGFRVDAIRYLVETDEAVVADTPETHAFIQRMRKTIGDEFPDALLVGEAWSGVDDQAGYFGDGQGLHLAFSFDMAARIQEAVRDGVRSSLNQILDRSREVIADRGFEAPFLTNHDMPRIARGLGWDKARLRLAAALLFSSPGTPFIYYGEEIAMGGGEGREDEYKRTPMLWTDGVHHGFTKGTPWWPIPDEEDGTDVAAQKADQGSLLNLYRKLIALRKSSVALRRGDQRRLEVKGGRGVVAFVREHPDERVLVVVNLDKKPSEPFDAPVSGKPSVLFAEGLDEPPSQREDAIAIPALGPRAFAFIRLE